MNHLALIGYPLHHSFSKEYFEQKFKDESIPDYDYMLIEIKSLDNVKEVVAQYDLLGFNVTSPFKQQIIQYLDHISEDAKSIGAVNCVRIDNGEWYGYNTDWRAFLHTLEAYKGSIKNALALILGTGGAAHAAAYALDTMGIKHKMVSRKPQEMRDVINYSDARQLMQTRQTFLINATPVGMYPDIKNCPWPFSDGIDKTTLVYDLIYNPSQTALLHLASTANVPTRNGLDMLHLQADYSWKIFQDHI